MLVCSLAFRAERGTPGEGFVCPTCIVCPLAFREGYTRGRLVCPSCNLSSGAPRGAPGEGLSVFRVVCPLVFRKGCQGKAVCPSCRLSLYPHLPAHPTACSYIILYSCKPQNLYALINYHYVSPHPKGISSITSLVSLPRLVAFMQVT